MEYRTGHMPHTDLGYEEFEGLLGSYYLSVLPLKNSKNPEDKKDYETILQILNGFSERYNIQSPEDAVKNPRSKEDWGNPEVFPSFSMMDSFHSFTADFGVGNEPYTIDREDKIKLGRTILGIFERYRIAEILFQEDNGEKIPIGIKKLDIKKGFQNLADIIKE
jgi:hypothetical protein